MHQQRPFTFKDKFNPLSNQHFLLALSLHQRAGVPIHLHGSSATCSKQYAGLGGESTACGKLETDLKKVGKHGGEASSHHLGGPEQCSELKGPRRQTGSKFLQQQMFASVAEYILCRVPRLHQEPRSWQPTDQSLGSSCCLDENGRILSL